MNTHTEPQQLDIEVESLKYNVRELQEQLQDAYKRIKELNEEVMWSQKQ
jgi:peptidoglycan hydrolase CwlO-like protein